MSPSGRRRRPSLTVDVNRRPGILHPALSRTAAHGLMASVSARSDRAPDRRSAMPAVIVIPARHASTRLPGKPLLKETGKYLIQHVYERAAAARRASAVLVATDDPRIVAAVDSFRGRVLLTRRDHPSG